MKRITKKELMHSIDKDFNSTQKISKQEIGTSLDKLFFDKKANVNVTKCESTFDESNPIFIRKNNDIAFKKNKYAYSDILFQIKDAIKSIWIKYLFVLTFLILCAVVFIGQGYTHVAYTILNDIAPHEGSSLGYSIWDIQYQLDFGFVLATVTVVAPIIITSLIIIPLYIISIRSDNYISRLRVNGLQKNNLFLSLLISSFLICASFIFILFFIVGPIVVTIFSRGENYYKFIGGTMPGFFIQSLILSLSFSTIGIIIGFKVKEQRVVFILASIMILIILWICLVSSGELYNVRKDRENYEFMDKLYYWSALKFNPIFYMIYGPISDSHFVFQSYDTVDPINGKSWIGKSSSNILEIVSLSINISILILISLLHKKIINFKSIG